MALASLTEYEQWPHNPLDAARRAFGWLTAGEHPVAVDGCVFDYLPDREVPVDELRDLLLRRACPRPVWDQVWTHVITRARAEGGPWTVVAVGLALPMLTPMAARLTRHYADDPTDIHAELLRGFLDKLQVMDLPRGRIAIRLRWAAYRAGHHALTTAMDGPTPTEPDVRPGTPAPVSGHPDLVLARAVNAGVLTSTEAELISATRLGGVMLTDWPRQNDCSYNKLRKFRSRAEHRLAAWLAETTDGAAPDDASRVPTAPKTAGAVADQPPESGLQGCA